LVARDAFAGDGVCVPPRIRAQAADNIAAPSRALPNGLCIPGYVWRRANPDDHVCVTRATREQTQSDNQAEPLPTPPLAPRPGCEPNSTDVSCWSPIHTAPPRIGMPWRPHLPLHDLRTPESIRRPTWRPTTRHTTTHRYPSGAKPLHPTWHIPVSHGRRR